MNVEEKLLDRFISKHTIQALTFLENYPQNEILSFIMNIKPHQGGLLLGMMDRYTAAAVMNNIEVDSAAKFIEHMSISAAVHLIRQLGPEKRKSILNSLSPSLSAQLLAMIQYPENSIASITDTEVFTLYEDHTVEQAIGKMKKNKLPVYPHLFVISRAQILVGSITIETLLKAGKNQPVDAIMTKDPIQVDGEMKIEYLLEANSWDSNYLALPVVTGKNQFIGVITRDRLTKIQRKSSSKERQLNSAGKALGDLYRIGFTSLLHSTTTIPTKSK